MPIYKLLYKSKKKEVYLGTRFFLCCFQTKSYLFWIMEIENIAIHFAGSVHLED